MSKAFSDIIIIIPAFNVNQQPIDNPRAVEDLDYEAYTAERAIISALEASSPKGNLLKKIDDFLHPMI